MALRVWLNRLYALDEGDGPGVAEPYVFSVYFKIDADTVDAVWNGASLKEPWVVGGGRHDNAGEVDAGRHTWAQALGSFHHIRRATGLEPLVGVIGLILEEDAAPSSDVMAKAGAEFVRTVEAELVEQINARRNLPVSDWLSAEAVVAFVRKGEEGGFEEVEARITDDAQGKFEEGEATGTDAVADSWVGWLGDVARNALGNLLATAVDRDDVIGAVVQAWPLSQLRRTTVSRRWESSRSEDGRFAVHASGEWLADHPAVVRLADGSLHTFVRGALDSQVWHAVARPGEGWVPSLSPVTGPIASAPAVVTDDGRTIHLFARAEDGQLIANRFDGSWGGWEALGGRIVSAPTACSWGPGRIDVFAPGLDLRLFHLAFDGGWHDWEPFGGVCTSEPAAVSWGPGRIDVFHRDEINELFHWYFDGGRWDHHRLDPAHMNAPIASAPGLAVTGSGKLHVFTRDGEGALRHLAWDRDWLDVTSLGNPPAPSALPDLVEQILPEPVRRVLDAIPPLPVPGIDPPTPTPPSLFDVDLGAGITSAPAVAGSPDGGLDVLVTARGNVLWHRRKTAGAWSDWALVPLLPYA